MTAIRPAVLDVWCPDHPDLELVDCGGNGKGMCPEDYKVYALPVTVAALERAHLLQYAARLVAVPSDAAAVTAAASPLLDWLEEADSADDLQARCLALNRCYHSSVAGNFPGGPAEFISRAGVLYAFLTTGKAGDS